MIKDFNEYHYYYNLFFSAKPFENDLTLNISWRLDMGRQVLRALCPQHLSRRMCSSQISLNALISLQDYVSV
jgi:hypothetical protein